MAQIGKNSYKVFLVLDKISSILAKKYVHQVCTRFLAKLPHCLVKDLRSFFFPSLNEQRLVSLRSQSGYRAMNMDLNPHHGHGRGKNKFTDEQDILASSSGPVICHKHRYFSGSDDEYASRQKTWNTNSHRLQGTEFEMGSIGASNCKVEYRSLLKNWLSPSSD